MAKSGNPRKKPNSASRPAQRSKGKIRLNGHSLTLEDLRKIARGSVSLSIAASAAKEVRHAARLVDRAAHGEEPRYGINTGFGRFCNIRISEKELRELQVNLIRSHAAGVGEPCAPEEVRLAIALRANALLSGNSGIRLEVIQLLLDLYNHDILPKIPRQGSVGACGDLAPLSHLALVLIGEGEALVSGKWVSGKKALSKVGLKPVRLEAKEGLSLINGVQVSVAMLARACHLAEYLVEAADLTLSMSLEGFLGSLQPFDERIHKVRPHPGQATVAQNVRRLLKGSKILKSHENCDRVQDPYSFRCAPQVHGSVRDALEWIGQTIEREANSSTDNPLVFSHDEDILSGGNFHGAPVAHAADLLAIVLCDLASISERRCEKLVNPDTSRGLPAFLSREEGLQSGWMMAHVTASALVSRMKVLSHPASVDSMVTSAGTEDHVSMSTHASEKALECAHQTARVVGIELLVAMDALDLRRPLKSGQRLEARLKALRNEIPSRGGDRVLSPEIEKAAQVIEDGTLIQP
ncbi:histidine ammonia-lyase [bacterium TMED181]|nr:histidine ammonia-lyase [Planctomycetota bacterium]OUW43144.1 MAG: histidine ammonia-lyase [bacterium TMED181]